MLLADDTRNSLAAAVDLVDTTGRYGRLSQDWVDGWWERHLYTGKRRRTSGELRALGDLRPRLRALFLSPSERAAKLVNAMLVEADATPQVVRHGDVSWHIHAVGDSAPLERRVLVESAMAVIDLIRFDEMQRVRVCEDRSCVDLVLDVTRNHSRRYCSVTCTNRNAVAAYRSRQAVKQAP